MFVLGFAQVKTAVVGKIVTVGLTLFSVTVTLAVEIQPAELEAVTV